MLFFKEKYKLQNISMYNLDMFEAYRLHQFEYFYALRLGWQETKLPAANVWAGRISRVKNKSEGIISQLCEVSYNFGQNCSCKEWAGFFKFEKR